MRLISGFCSTKEERGLFNESFSKLVFLDSDIEKLREQTIKQNSGKERAPKIIPLLDKIEAGNAIFVFEGLMSILNEAYNKKDVRYVGLSEGWCDKYIDILLNYTDVDIQCIHCLRDPRAIVASRNGGSRLHVKKYPLLFILRHWRTTIAYYILLNNNPKYMAVQYENLVHEPELWFKKMCHFLAVPFSESLLDTSGFLNGDGSPWIQNSALQVSSKKSINVGSLFKWKEVLSREEIGVIEYLCKEEMDLLELERINLEFSLQDLISYKENDDEIIEWLRKYNLTFNENELMLEIVRKYLIESNQNIDVKDLIDYLVIDKKVFGKLAKSMGR